MQIRASFLNTDTTSVFNGAFIGLVNVPLISFYLKLEHRFSVSTLKWLENESASNILKINSNEITFLLITEMCLFY